MWPFQCTRTFWALMVMPALPLDVHGVEVLLPHVAGVDGAGQFEDPVREGGLPVVDVGHDAQVSNAVEVQRGPCYGKEGEHVRSGSSAPMSLAQCRPGPGRAA